MKNNRFLGNIVLCVYNLIVVTQVLAIYVHHWNKFIHVETTLEGDSLINPHSAKYPRTRVRENSYSDIFYAVPF